MSDQESLLAPVQIHSFEIRDVKSVRSVTFSCDGEALTIIGGDNGQGKTTLLDAICYTLGGAKYKPTALARPGAEDHPYMRVELSNGLVVERQGKNSSLKVTAPNGLRGNQTLMDGFLSLWALDMPKFMLASPKEKATILLSAIGEGEKLAALDRAEVDATETRRLRGLEAKRTATFFESLPHFPDAPVVAPSLDDLLAEQRRVSNHNRDVDNLANELATAETDARAARASLARAEEAIRKAQQEAEEAQDYLKRCEQVAGGARSRTEQSTRLSDADVLRRLGELETVQSHCRANSVRATAKDEADECETWHAGSERDVAKIRRDKADLLASAALPMPGLAIEGGELTYQGYHWDGMSGADRLQVATAIVRALKPECGFVLVDKLEAFDPRTLHEYASWLRSVGLQAIGTRVSTGPECSLILEDGSAIELPEDTETQGEAK